MAKTYKDTKDKYLTADELIERSYTKRNSIRKIRLNNLLLEPDGNVTTAFVKSA